MPKHFKLYPLHYQRFRHSWRRWWMLTCSLTVVLVALSLGIGWPRYQQFMRRVSERRLVDSCLHYSLPPETVVFEPHPAAAAELIRNGSYKLIDRDAVRIIPCWKALAAKIGEAWTETGLFCHQRRSPGGRERLVVITRIGGGMFCGFVIDVSSPSTPKVLRATIAGRYKPIGPPVMVLPNQGPPTVFAGQSDGQDESHFTMRYRYASQYGIIDG
jgi:hypothetical protein